MNLPLELLDSYAAFARVGNFTHAAKACGLSQPAMHARVAKLANLVGEPLYRRNGRALELTAFGTELAEFAARLVAQCERFTAARVVARAQLPVRLQAGEGSLLYLLSAVIRRCVQRGLPLDLRVGVGEATLAALIADQADIGVLSTIEPPDPELYESKRIAEVGARVIVPRTHALAGEVEVAMAQLSYEPWIVPAAGRPHRLRLEKAWAGLGASPQIALEVAGWPLSMQMVSLGLGVTVVPDICSVPRGLVAITVTDFELPDYYALRSTSAVPTDAARQLWSWLRAV